MKVYLISGKSRHGKDTLGSMLKEIYEEKGQKVCITQYSKYIKGYAKDYFGWDGNDDTKPRELLQILGTDIIREKLNKPLFHINRLLEDVEILSNFFDVLIVTDVRFPIEIDIPKEKIKDCVSINIYRPNYTNNLTDEQRRHISEHALDEYDNYDYKVVNTTIEELKDIALNIVRKEEVKDEKND